MTHAAGVSKHLGKPLTSVVAGCQHTFICRAGTDVPDLTRLMQEDILIYDVILIIKIYDVDLQHKKRTHQVSNTLLSIFIRHHDYQVSPNHFTNPSLIPIMLTIRV